MWKWYNILALILLILGLLLLIGGGIWYADNSRNGISIKNPEWTILLGMILLVFAGVLFGIGIGIGIGAESNASSIIRSPGDEAFRQRCRDMPLGQLRLAEQSNPLITEKCGDIIRGKAFGIEP